MIKYIVIPFGSHFDDREYNAPVEDREFTDVDEALKWAKQCKAEYPRYHFGVVVEKEE